MGGDRGRQPYASARGARERDFAFASSMRDVVVWGAESLWMGQPMTSSAIAREIANTP